MNVEPVNSSSLDPNSSDKGDQTDASATGVQPSNPAGGSVTPAASTADSSTADPSTAEAQAALSEPAFDLFQQLLTEFEAELPPLSAQVQAVVRRIAVEIERICSKSDRIQVSGDVQHWQINLARHRLQKCLNYYRIGSRQGRVELQSHLSTMVYRHIAPHQAQLGFSGRYSAIEDFLQGFYAEAIKAFRRENDLPSDYQPQTRLELAEYMTFTEQYAKRRIALPGRRKQQLIVLRAQGYANRQPPEAVLDIEMAMDSAKGEEAELHSRSPLLQQVREQMVSEAIDPTDSVIRDRVIAELIAYLEEQNQKECIDYLTLKLNDCSAPEIDEILELSPRKRDYLQQRFKYHVERFARSHRWQLVHQWLGADLDQNLGLTRQQWDLFLEQLTPEQQQLLQLKSKHLDDQDIAKALKCTLKQVQKRWVKLLELAWQARNSSSTAAMDS